MTALDTALAAALAPVVRQVVRDELARALAGAGLAHERPLSAERVARMVGRRTAVVLAALQSGELPGSFNGKAHGGKGRWAVKPADARKWAEV